MGYPRKRDSLPQAGPGRRRAGRVVALVMGTAALALVVSCSFPTAMDDSRRVRKHPGDTVQLSWNASSGGTLAGYKLYMGTASGAYGSPTVLGLVTTTSVNSLTPGATYYFALTAFNSLGQESPKTPELSYLAP